MKILPCNRCQHFISKENAQYSLCNHPQTQSIDFITGKTEPMFCSILRGLHGRCGNEGKLWAYDDAFPPSEEWEA
jgi:hypothetical protein